MSAVTAPLKRSHPQPLQTPDGGLRVVAPPVRRHTLAFALAMVAVIAGIVFGAVTLNALAAAAAVEARELDVTVADAEREYAQLVADVAALEDPARIRKAAEDMGLRPAGPDRYVVLERNLPADGVATAPIQAGTPTDPLKPLLSEAR